MQKPKGSGDERVKELVPGHPLFKTLVHFPAAFPAGREARRTPQRARARRGGPVPSPSPTLPRFSDSVAPPWAAGWGPDLSGDLRLPAPARAPQAPAPCQQPRSLRTRLRAWCLEGWAGEGEGGARAAALGFVVPEPRPAARGAGRPGGRCPSPSWPRLSGTVGHKRGNRGPAKEPSLTKITCSLSLEATSVGHALFF